MTFTAWVIPPRPAADLINHLVITDDDRCGRAVFSRALTYGVGTAAVWDAGLARAGYERVSAWKEAGDGWRYLCEVRLAELPSGPA